MNNSVMAVKSLNVASRALLKKCGSWRKYETYDELTIEQIEYMAGLLGQLADGLTEKLEVTREAD
jgi:RimJ/RimL family protein N-acetyltransferase